MWRTVWIFAIAGPAIAGLPFYGSTILALPFVWLLGALPMLLAGVAYNQVAERAWRVYAATFPTSERKRYSFALLMGTLAGAFAAFAISALVVTQLVPMDIFIAGLLRRGSGFPAAVLALARQFFLNIKLAIALGAVAGAVSAMLCCLFDGRLHWRMQDQSAADGNERPTVPGRAPG